MMENFEENESPPLILKETEKLYKNWELNQEKLLKSKNELEQKHRYLAQLQQQKDQVMKYVAQKQATLSTLQKDTKQYEATNQILKNRAMEISKTYDTLCKEMNDIEKIYMDAEKRMNKVENMLGNKLSKEETIGTLCGQLNELKSRHENEIKDVENRKSILCVENNALKTQLIFLKEIKKKSYDEYSENTLTKLENISIELEKKLEALRKENCLLQSEHEANRFESLDETEFNDLDLRYNQVESQIKDLSTNLDNTKTNQTKLERSKINLEESLKKIANELCQTSNKWNYLEKGDKGYMKIKQEVEQIKQDIADREKKYCLKKNELSNTEQLIKNEDENIQQIITDIDKMSLELNEIKTAIDNSQSSEYYNDQLKMIKQIITEAEMEMETLQKMTKTKENNLSTLLEQLKKDKDANAIELMTLKNNKLVEMTVLEKKLADLDQNKAKIENELKSNENIENELAESLKKMKTRQDQLCLESKQTEKEIGDIKRTFELMTARKEQVKKQLITPKVKEKVPVPITKTKRNWDSDSSMEVEEIKFNDYLRRKYRKDKKPK